MVPVGVEVQGLGPWEMLEGGDGSAEERFRKKCRLECREAEPLVVAWEDDGIADPVQGRDVLGGKGGFRCEVMDVLGCRGRADSLVQPACVIGGRGVVGSVRIESSGEEQVDLGSGGVEGFDEVYCVLDPFPRDESGGEEKDDFVAPPIMAFRERGDARCEF